MRTCAGRLLIVYGNVKLGRYVRNEIFHMQLEDWCMSPVGSYLYNSLLIYMFLSFAFITNIIMLAGETF